MVYDSSMDTAEAALLARNLMDKHGLAHVPLKWSRGKKSMGHTSFCRETLEVQSISLSRLFVEVLTDEEIIDTILHEIAHALVGIRAGHGPVWKAKARELGATPKAGFKATATPTPKYTTRCPKGHRRTANRLPLRVKSCGKCSSRFNLDNLISYYEGGKKVPESAMPSRYRAELANKRARSLLAFK
jgi:predicted SprT family Zn-dependent metalloprotease